MGRRNYGLKFEDDFIEVVDTFAESIESTREELIERAITEFINGTTGEGVPVQLSRTGARIAFWCPKCEPPRPRVFLSDENAFAPRCDKHGLMVRQENRPYFGRPTS